MSEQHHNPHEKIEKNVGLLAVLIAVAVSFGGLAQIIPLMFQAETIKPLPGVKPYPALELAGRDIYVREGCYNCHSQSATATTRWPANRSTTIRSSGAASAPAPIWRASAAVIRTTGIACT